MHWIIIFEESPINTKNVDYNNVLLQYFASHFTTFVLQGLWCDAEKRHPKTMAAPVRTNQVNQVIRRPRTTFGDVVVICKQTLWLSRRSRIYPEYLLSVDLFLNAESNVKSQRDSNDNHLLNSLKF